MAMPLPAEYSRAVAKAERALAGIETLDQRDGSNAIYDAWFAVAKLHAQQKLPGGSDTIRAVTIDALSRLVRKGVSFVAHTLADDYVVVAMLQHAAKIFNLINSKPKFQALLISPEAIAAQAAAGEAGAASTASDASAGAEIDPVLIEIAGTAEQRRRFADALPGSCMENVMAVATSAELGTERRSSALQVVTALATLATAAKESEPDVFRGSDLLSAVSSDVVALIAASSGSDGVLRDASMQALRAAAGKDAASYAPRVAKALLARASDVQSLVPVWGMGSLRDTGCMDLVVARIRKEWAAAARKVRDAESLGAVGADPALSGVSTSGFLGIAGGGGSDAVGMSDDTIALPAFTKAAVASLFESLLNDRAESGSATNILSASVSSVGTGRRTMSAALPGAGDVDPILTSGHGGSAAMEGAGTIADGAAEGVVRILAESDVVAALRAGAISRSRVVGEDGGGGGMVGRSRASSKSVGASTPAPGGGGVHLADVDMDVAPERSSEWLDLARVALELRPNDERIIRLVLAYPSQESLEMLGAAVPLFSGSTWCEVVLPWLHGRISELGSTVSGSASEQAIIDSAREWTRSLFESGSAASSSLAIGSASGSAMIRLPHHSIGRMFFQTCLLAISRGYSETERFPEIAAKILSAYLAAGHMEAVTWVSDAMAPAITRTNASFRASTEIVLTLVGAEAATLGGDVGSGSNEAEVADSDTKSALLRAASANLSPGALSMWSSLSLNGESWVRDHPESVDIFVEAAENELDRAIGRMSGDRLFAKHLLQAQDEVYEASEAASVKGRVSTSEVATWDTTRSVSNAGSLSVRRAGTAASAASEATAAAMVEAHRIIGESSLGEKPFSVEAASLTTLPAAQARRKVMELVDALRSVAHVAPPSSAASLFSALLKGLALLPPHTAGAHRSDYEAASLIDKIAAHRTATALAVRTGGAVSVAASVRAASQPALPAEVVEQALTTLGPVARASLARLFPALCMTDDDPGVRLTALEGLSNVAWTPRGASLMSSPKVLIGLLQAVPTDYPLADREVAKLVLGPANMRWAEHWPCSSATAAALPWTFRRLCQGLSRPTSDILQRSTSSMYDVQVTAAPAVAAAAIATARDAEAVATAILASVSSSSEASGAAGDHEMATMAAKQLDRAAAVVTACCSRLLMAAVDSAANDAESMPSRVVVNALGSIATNTPESVLHAMARSSAGRARLDDLRRSSPQWAAQIQSMVTSGVLRARAQNPQRRSVRGDASPYAALPTSEDAVVAALPIPGGVPSAAARGVEAAGLVPDWGRASTASVMPSAGRYEFEMTSTAATAAAAAAAAAAAESGVRVTAPPVPVPTTEAGAEAALPTSAVAAQGDYAHVLRQFQHDTAVAIAESDAMAKARAAAAPVAERPSGSASLPIPAAAVLSAEAVRFPMATAPPDSSDTESVADGVFGGSAGAESDSDRVVPRVGPVGNPGQQSIMLQTRRQAAESASATRSAAQQRHRNTWAALRGIRGSAGRAVQGTKEETASLTGGMTAAAASSAGVSLMASSAALGADSSELTPGALSDDESLLLLFPEAPTAIALPSRKEQAQQTATASTTKAEVASSGDDSAMLMFAM